MGGRRVISVFYIVSFTVLGEVTVLYKWKAKQQPVFIGRRLKEGAPIMDGTKATAVKGKRGSRGEGEGGAGKRE